MKCSTKTMETIRDLLIADYQTQVLERKDPWVDKWNRGCGEIW